MSKTAIRSISESGESLSRLPDNFAGLSPEEKQAVFKKRLNAVHVLKQLVELQSAQRQIDGAIQQLEANAEQVEEELHTTPDLPEHRKKHMRGRISVYAAKIEREQEMRGIYQIQIDLYNELITRGQEVPACHSPTSPTE